MTRRDLIDESIQRSRPMQWAVGVLYCAGVGAILYFLRRDAEHPIAAFVFFFACITGSRWLDRITFRKIPCPACKGSLGKILSRDNGIPSLRLGLNMRYCPLCAAKFDEEMPLENGANPLR